MENPEERFMELARKHKGDPDDAWEICKAICPRRLAHPLGRSSRGSGRGPRHHRLQGLWLQLEIQARASNENIENFRILGNGILGTRCLLSNYHQ